MDVERKNERERMMGGWGGTGVGGEGGVHGDDSDDDDHHVLKFGFSLKSSHLFRFKTCYPQNF